MFCAHQLAILQLEYCKQCRLLLSAAELGETGISPQKYYQQFQVETKSFASTKYEVLGSIESSRSLLQTIRCVYMQ